MKSPLRWLGAKTKVLASLDPFIPHDFTTYVEPFLGGASVLLHVKQTRPKVNNFHVNDVYPALFNFWDQMQSNSVHVFQKIDQLWDIYKAGGMASQVRPDGTIDYDADGRGRRLYNFCKDVVSRSDIPKDHYDMWAACFYILNRITFSGATEAGSFSAESYAKRLTDTTYAKLKEVPPILTDNVKITNTDFSEVLNQTPDDAFVYLDPPYSNAKKLYGPSGKLHDSFNMDGHERLVSHLKQAKYRWLLTYDDSPLIRELYGFANLNEVSVVYGAGNKNIQASGKSMRKTELYITNYEPR